jgi:hypothetical protein
MMVPGHDDARCTPRRRPARVAVGLLLAVGIAWPRPAATTAWAQVAPDPLAVQQQVAKLLSAGEYAALVESTAGIEKTLRAKSRDPAYAPKMRLLTDLLVARALAERRLGRLDAADASLEAAASTIAEKDLQRLIVMFMRSGGENAVPVLVPLELTNLDLMDARVEALLDRIEMEPGPDAADAAVAEAANARRRAYGVLAQQSRQLREGLPERLEKAEPAVRGSPRARMLASEARPLLHEARVALIVAVDRKEAAAAPGAAAPAGGQGNAGAASPNAIDLCVKALAAADAAMAGALSAVEPAAEGQEAKPEGQEPKPGPELEAARREAALVRAPLLEWLSRARLAEGDLTGARETAEKALAERAAAGQQNHPDLVEPLILLGEIALADGRAAAEQRRTGATSAAFDAAALALTRARDVVVKRDAEFLDKSALRQRIMTLLAEAVATRDTALSRATSADLVDGASGRALRALRLSPPAAPVGPPTSAVPQATE